MGTHARRPSICVVLPTYNESQNVATLIPAIFAQAEKIATHDIHVVVVDDNSPDDTAARVMLLQQRFLRLKLLRGSKNGLGEAYKRGFAYALEELTPEFLLQMDADWQHSPHDLPRLLAQAVSGSDIVIGSRFVAGSATPGFPASRRLISKVGNGLLRLCSGIWAIHDATSGFRCIRADLIKRCGVERINARGYAFQSILLFRLVGMGASVAEIPIIFPNRARGSSKLALRDKLEFVVNLIRLRRG